MVVIRPGEKEGTTEALWLQQAARPENFVLELARTAIETPELSDLVAEGKINEAAVYNFSEQAHSTFSKLFGRGSTALAYVVMASKTFSRTLGKYLHHFVDDKTGIRRPRLGYNKNGHSRLALEGAEIALAIYGAVLLYNVSYTSFTNRGAPDPHLGT